MSLTTTVQDWMRAVGPREASIATARNHVFAETSTDTDVICATISRDVFFGVPVRTREANEIPEGSVLTTYDQVRGYYSGRAGAYVVLASAQLKSIATEWYVFNESAASLRGTGMIGELDATGKEFVVNSAVLFPTAPDGIRGEVCVTRYPFDDIVRDTVVTPPPVDDPRTYLPLREMQHCELLDRVAGALRDHDAAALRTELAQRHTLAVRLDDVDGEQTVRTAETADDATAALGAMFDSAEDLTLTTRIATDWYVFAEYLLRLDGGRVRRLALTHPAAGGVLTGTFGYGRDELTND
ncbi:MAG: hypothetical protein KDB21_06695 [Acidimicrobiales bacterium]|nr:hypothetical protein [Acidimicrobiales bacterium]